VRSAFDSIVTLFLGIPLVTKKSSKSGINTSLYRYIPIWMLVVHLCSIHGHKTVWRSLVLAVKASLWEYGRGQLCCVMTSRKIHLLRNESQESFIRFRIWYWKWTFVLFSINRKKHERPLWKYAKL
jgi:hypothetical protein